MAKQDVYILFDVYFFIVIEFYCEGSIKNFGHEVSIGLNL